MEFKMFIEGKIDRIDFNTVSVHSDNEGVLYAVNNDFPTRSAALLEQQYADLANRFPDARKIQIFLPKMTFGWNKWQHKYINRSAYVKPNGQGFDTVEVISPFLLVEVGGRVNIEKA